MIIRYVYQICLTLVILSVGCSKKGETVSVKGKLTQGGKAIQVQAMSGRVTVAFYLVKEGQPATASDPQSAMVKPDGTFEVFGPDSKGIPPGKYKVAIAVLSGTPDAKGMSDALGGAFTIEKTPIEIEVKQGQEIIIELDDYKKK